MDDLKETPREAAKRHQELHKVLDAPKELSVSEFINKAKDFAIEAHTGQFRKYGGEPYWYHCRDVAFLVEAAGGSPAMIAAAWLHDVVEDTKVKLEEIEANFGPKVAALVEMLTDTSVPSDGNRAARRAIDRAHSAKASEEGKTIKLADLISNSSSIMRCDKDFAKLYMSEKKLLLQELMDGDIILYSMALRILSRYFNEQKE
jgi:(p)ppGpp synthase/HD superfamily hydrolase